MAVTDLEMKHGSESFLIVRCSKRYFFLVKSAIDMVQAEGNSVRIFCGSDMYLVRETLNDIEKRLPSPPFLRVSRSAVININGIRELKRKRALSFEVTMSNGRTCVWTRSYRQHLDALFGKEHAV